MPNLNLSLLGHFQAILNGAPLQKFRTNKVQALLIYLAVEHCQSPGILHRRDALMTMLWANAPPESAQSNLRQTIYYLRKTIPLITVQNGKVAEFIIADRQTVRLNPYSQFKIDISDFTRLIRQGNEHVKAGNPQSAVDSYQQAAELYQGDFLTDFYLPDSNQFEEWAAVQRQTFRREMLEALEAVATLCLEQEAFAEAEKAARQQLAIDDLRDVAHRQLIEILARSGRRRQALTHYENYCRLLSDELGLEPAEDTIALHQLITRGDFDEALPQAVRGYQLQKQIGSGAFGSVFLAHQTAVHRDVAIKIIRSRIANHPDFIRRFEAEAQMVARLEHPHIVPLYDYWREPDGAYLVMRRLRGGSLKESLSNGPFPLQKALLLIDQITTALHAAHRQGIIHRDLKPANILLDEDGNAYLTDFGIAKNLTANGNITENGNLIGSPAYISPEQIRGESVTRQTDIYSLGVVLFELLTGRSPYGSCSPKALLDKHLHEPLPPVHKICPDLPPSVNEVIQTATAKNPAARFADAPAMALALHTAVQPNYQSLAPDLVGHELEIANPYKGLRPFQEADAVDFFGRETMVQQLGVQLLADQKIVALVGPSGSGKSSIVKAGVLPFLRNLTADQNKTWFFAEMTPGSHPWQAMDNALSRIATNRLPELQAQMQANDEGLLQSIHQLLPADGQLLLVIDQFEELFTLVENEDTRVQFLQSLVTAVTDSQTPLRLLITLRADYYDKPLHYSGMAELLRDNTTVVLPMMPAELAQAITCPAQRVGVAFESSLIATITADIKAQPAALPLLQYALTELFERRNGRNLTLTAYESIGGIAGALARRAEAIYADLDAAGQTATCQLLLRLISSGEDGEATCRRVLQSELGQLNGQNPRYKHEFANAEKAFAKDGNGQQPPDDPSIITDLINMLGRYRLLAFDRDPVSREPTVEVAHEALLREWPRLREWLDESRDDMRQQQKMATAVSDWLDADKNASYLLLGARLAHFAAWAESSTFTLTTDEQAYLTASIQARDERAAQREAQRQRELQSARHLAEVEKAASQRLRRRAISLAGVLVVAVVLAAAAIILGRQSQNNANIAATRLTQAVANAELANLREGEAIANADLAATHQAEAQHNAALAVAAADAEATAAAEARTQQTLAETSAREAQLAYSQILASQVDHLLAEGNQELALLLALAANQVKNPPAAARHALLSAAFAPATRRVFSDRAAAFKSAAVSPDGRFLLAGDTDNNVVLWNVETGAVVHRLTGHENSLWDAEFSADGRFALSGAADGLVILWDLQSGEMVRWFTGHSGEVFDVAFHPDGQTAVSGGYSGGEGTFGEIIWWDLQTGEVLAHFGDGPDGHAEGVRAVAISPDGRTVLAGSANTEPTTQTNIILWDLETGEPVKTFAGVERSINDVAFLPDGRFALAAAADNNIYLWDIESGEQTAIFAGHTAYAIDVAVSPDGRTFLSAGGDGQMIWWDTATGQPIRTYQGHTDEVWGVAFLPDGLSAISAAHDGMVRLWDLTSQWERGPLNGNHNANTTNVAVSPDGQWVLSGSGRSLLFDPVAADNSLILWNVQTGEMVRHLEGHTDSVTGIAFTPDSRFALSNSFDGSTRLWDLLLGEMVQQVQLHEGPGFGLAVSPDGRTALSAGYDLTVVHWELETGKILQRLVGHTALAYDVAFLPDGQHAISTSYDETMILWELETGLPVHYFIGNENFPGHYHNTRGVALSPDGEFVLSTSDDGTMILWEVATAKPLRRFQGENGVIMAAAFHPDGNGVVSIAADGTIVLWDVTTGAMVQQIAGDGVTMAARGLTLSPDGRTIYSTGANGRVQRWSWQNPSPADLVQWIAENRYVRELTCEERVTFSLTPLCGENGVLPVAVADSLAIDLSANETHSLPASQPIPQAIMPVAQAAQNGANQGYLTIGMHDVWIYTGTGGEAITLRMTAADPDSLDAVLLVVGPDGRLLVANDDDGRSLNSEIEGLTLPEEGSIRIEAHSLSERGAGEYTLTIMPYTPPVSEEVLQRYVGQYLHEDMDGLIVTIYWAGHKLYFDAPGFGVFAMQPETETEFDVNGMPLTFLLDTDGTVTGYDNWYAGEPYHGERLDE